MQSDIKTKRMLNIFRIVTIALFVIILINAKVQNKNFYNNLGKTLNSVIHNTIQETFDYYANIDAGYRDRVRKESFVYIYNNDTKTVYRGEKVTKGFRNFLEIPQVGEVQFDKKDFNEDLLSKSFTIDDPHNYIKNILGWKDYTFISRDNGIEMLETYKNNILVSKQSL